TVPDSKPTKTLSPSRAKSTATMVPDRLNFFSSFRVCTSQMHSVPAPSPAARRVPSGLHRAQRTNLARPVSVANVLPFGRSYELVKSRWTTFGIPRPFAVSQSVTSPSHAARHARDPSGEKLADGPVTPVWNFARALTVLAS